MASSSTTNKSFLAICTLLAVVLASGKWASGQSCCPSNMCRSKFGFCGSGEDYCGEGCQCGPCINPPRNSGISVSEVVTDAFFNRIMNQAGGGCPGRGFYSRSAFLAALNTFGRFGTQGSADDSKREIAAFFAHVTHETGSMCSIVGGDQSNNHCNRDFEKEWPCEPGKSYYERGPLQLVGNNNYGPAGRDAGFDGLKDPDIVARDPVVSFKASLWFWMTFCHDHIVSGRGFGATIRAMNGGLECSGANTAAVNNRVNYYRNYCAQLGVDPGTNLQC